jgi:hypothetical protein
VGLQHRLQRNAAQAASAALALMSSQTWQNYHAALVYGVEQLVLRKRGERTKNGGRPSARARGRRAF